MLFQSVEGADALIVVLVDTQYASGKFERGKRQFSAGITELYDFLDALHEGRGAQDQVAAPEVLAQIRSKGSWHGAGPCLLHSPPTSW